MKKSEWRRGRLETVTATNRVAYQLPTLDGEVGLLWLGVCEWYFLNFLNL